jgi:hypothetical protein
MLPTTMTEYSLPALRKFIVGTEDDRAYLALLRPEKIDFISMVRIREYRENLFDCLKISLFRQADCPICILDPNSIYAEIIHSKPPDDKTAVQRQSLASHINPAFHLIDDWEKGPGYKHGRSDNLVFGKTNNMSRDTRFDVTAQFLYDNKIYYWNRDMKLRVYGVRDPKGKTDEDHKLYAEQELGRLRRNIDLSEGPSLSNKVEYIPWVEGMVCEVCVLPI